MIKLEGRIVAIRLFGGVKIERKAHNGNFQAKTAEPSPQDQTIVADTGYDALSLVTVKAATLQEKTVRPSSVEQIVVPDVGVYGLSKVIVPAQGEHGLLQKKTVTPSSVPQTVTPDNGYYGLESVTVEGITKISSVNIDESSDNFRITFEDDTTITGSVSFDEDGLAVALIDSVGNAVEFADGYPIGVTDKDGHNVSIIWG